MKQVRVVFAALLALLFPYSLWADVKTTQDISFISYHVEGNIDNSFILKTTIIIFTKGQWNTACRF